ncbi:MAG: radical SAM protein [Firmicutes bacterium]|nr:radical SAM protein [Bacillota bacterium]
MEFGRMARAGLGVFEGRITGKPKPMFVIISVTNRCPSRCNYCRIPCREQREMTTDELKSLIDQVVAAGTQRIGIWGGEPLVRDDIGEIIDYAVGRGLYVTLDSNGYLLPERIDLLKNLPHLLLSIDGDETSHDANREKGSYQKVLAAIKTASARKMNLWTITVLTKNNINDKSIDHLLDLADEYNFTTTYQLLHHQENFGDSTSMRPTDEEYRDCIKRLMEKKRQGRRIGTSFKLFKHLLEWSDHKHYMLPKQRSDWKCWAGKFYANVDADGKVYPCSLLVDHVPAKNFLEVGFEEAYKSISELPCQQCMATCYSEYNMLFSLNFDVIFEWATAFRNKKKGKKS